MSETAHRGSFAKRTALVYAVATLVAAAAATAQSNTNDPRVGLKPGLTDAGEASKNMALIAHVGKAPALDSTLRGLTYANSDLAFKGNYVFQGNFSGFAIWDISNITHPALKHATVCATDQGDPSIYGNLLFISAEATRGRLDCGTQGVKDTVSKDRMRGVRIFDVSDPTNPKPVANVQNCRGSHTHTLVQDPKDKANVYVYMSGSADVRSPNELPGCVSSYEDSVNTSLFRIDVIKVPLAHPEQAKIISGARIFYGLAQPHPHGNAPSDTGAVAQAGRGGRGGRGAGGRGPGPGPLRPPGGPNQCHDITVYPAVGLAGGACGGYGLLLDIRDVASPKRIDFAADSNFAFWHSATFNNDGTKVLFTDEWGGGTQPRCRATDPINWGGDAIFTITKDHKLKQDAYFKMPAAQTSTENCVAHNGSLVPVPGRDIMVQGWYQGGVDVFDFTDPSKPVEIAYFDRGPINADTLLIGGDWAGYYYNGHIFTSEIGRGLDIFELKPSEYLTENEIDAAASVHFDTFNPQDQPKIVWPATFALPRAYLDQLERNKRLSEEKIAQARKELDAAEKASGPARKSALTKAAAALEPSAAKSGDPAKVRMAVVAIRELAKK
jgi:hypothetical protein